VLARVLSAPSVEDRLVRVRTASGEFVGTWEGEDPVSVGQCVDIELDIGTTINWDDIELRPAGRPALEPIADDRVRVTGVVIEVDHSGVMVLDLGNGLLSLDTEGLPPTRVVGQLVSTTLHGIKVYPTGT
jgi:hypothetical protein